LQRFVGVFWIVGFFFRAAAAILIVVGMVPLASAESERFSGFNGGFTGAVAWSFDDQVEDPSNPPATFGAEIDLTSFGAGVFAGYDWQFDHVLFGVLGEGRLMTGQTDTFQWNATPGNLDTSFPVSAEVVAQMALRARIGGVFADTLFYLTGGLALAQVERGYYGTSAPFSSVHTTWDQGFV
jgi:hypothetical protein